MAERIVAGSVEASHHLILCQGLKVLNVTTLGCQNRTHMWWDQLVVQVCRDGKFCRESVRCGVHREDGTKRTMVVEIKEIWQLFGSAVGVTRVGQSRRRISDLIEERVDHGVNGRQPLCRGVLEELRNQIDRVGVGFA